MTESEAGLQPGTEIAPGVADPEAASETGARDGHDVAESGVDDEATIATEDRVTEDGVGEVGADEGEMGGLHIGEETDEETGGDFEDPTPYVPLEYVEVKMDLPSQYPILVLRESDGPRRRLEIPIGLSEGVAIAYADCAIATPRPLTHELFGQVLEAMGGMVETVRITGVVNNSFSAELVCSGPNGTQVFPCRTSDAVALVLRQYPPAPLTAAPGVLDAAGVVDPPA